MYHARESRIIIETVKRRGAASVPDRPLSENMNPPLIG